MTDESLEVKFAKLEARVSNQEEKTANHDRVLFGQQDGKSGIIAEQQLLKAENRYLKWVYVLATTIIMVPFTIVMQKLAPHLFPPVK